MKKIFLVTTIFLTSLAVILLIFLNQLGKNNFFSVSFLDVGQGDASLLEFSNGQNVLIDGGPDNLILQRLGEELPPYRRKINFMIISHFHDDHIMGLISVLERYQVEKIIFAAGLEKFVLGEYLLARAQEQQVVLWEIFQAADLRLNNDCVLSFINPLSLGIGRNDNNSLVTKLRCVGYNFLLAGDNEAEVEDALLLSNYDLSANILKASHHGSKTSNQSAFLSAVRPQIFVISVGKDNKFKHPALEILDLAKSLNLPIRRTDELGTVEFRINLANIK